MGEDRSTTRVDAHGFRWLAVSGFAGTIPLLDLDAVRQVGPPGTGICVKDNTVRTVARVDDPAAPDGPGLYIKRYKFRSLGERLKHLIIPTKPAQEWRVCRALQAAGISTCDVLAIAVRRRGLLPREGFLVSREVAGATTLREFAEAGQADETFAGGLVDELAQVTARLCAGGFYHSDYHAGNILLRPDAARGERILVVDLHSIRLYRPRRGQVLRMLGMLTQSCARPGAGAGDEEAFVRAFLGLYAGGRYASDASAWLAELRLARKRLDRRRMRSRTRRCMVESTMFTRDKAGGVVIHRRRDFPLESALAAARSHAEALAGREDAGDVLHSAARSAVTLCDCPAMPPVEVERPAPPEDLLPGTVCVKSFRRPSLEDRLKDLLRPRSRARASWIASHGMGVRGLPVAAPLALLEARGKLAGRPDYLIAEAIENDGTLGDLSERPLSPAQRGAICRAVAELLTRLADRAVYHPDTKPKNFLVKETDTGFRLWLVDPDRIRFDQPYTAALWVKVLGRVNAGLAANVTLLDRMRCLRLCSRIRWTPQGRPATGGPRWTSAERLAIARAAYELSLTRRPAWLR
jgi:tRNA A-37 threonylcarbamoyl transferase component Bud32